MSPGYREHRTHLHRLVACAALAACRVTQPVGALRDAAGDVADARDASDDRVEELTWRYGSVAAGGLRSCATVAGYAWCWGSPWGGALGRALDAPSAVPLLVAGVERVDEVAMGDRFSCALSLGSVWCWGENSEGQLGAPGADRPTPQRVATLDDVTAVAARVRTACALRRDGAWWCWGALARGAPRELVALRGAGSVAIGSEHLCARWPLARGGRVRCQGGNSAGQLGDGTTDRRDAPVDVLGDDGAPLTDVWALSVGGLNTCVIHGDRTEVRCWGALTPLPVVRLRADEPLRAVSVGDEHVCALTDAGRARCWGQNMTGQLGDGSTDASSAASLGVVALPEAVRLGALSAGLRHTCAMELSGSALWCWGFNASGQLGGGDLDAHLTPVRVALPGR